MVDGTSASGGRQPKAAGRARPRAGIAAGAKVWGKIQGSGRSDDLTDCSESCGQHEEYRNADSDLFKD